MRYVSNKLSILKNKSNGNFFFLNQKVWSIKN